MRTTWALLGHDRRLEQEERRSSGVLARLGRPGQLREAFKEPFKEVIRFLAEEAFSGGGTIRAPGVGVVGHGQDPPRFSLWPPPPAGAPPPATRNTPGLPPVAAAASSLD